MILIDCALEQKGYILDFWTNFEKVWLPMHVSLTPALESLIRTKVDSGLYNNASEVVREALRLLAAQDARLAPRGRRQTAAEILAAGAAVAALPVVDPRPVAEIVESLSTP